MRFFTPKRDGFIAVLLAATALCGALVYANWGGWSQVQAAVGKPMPGLPDLQVPEDHHLKEMLDLRTRLNRLAYPRAAVDAGVHLGLFGYAPASTALRQGAGGRSSTPPPSTAFDYTLSFALSAGSQQLCMLDGTLYAMGGRLPDGGRIVAIEPHRVLIEKKPLRRWIYLQVLPPGGELPAEASAASVTPNEEG